MARGRGIFGRLLLLAAVGISALSVLRPSMTFGKPGVVRTSEGQTYDGDVDEKDPDTVVVNVRGIETRIARNRVASIDYAGGAQTDFNGRLAKLPANDVQGRLAIAREAFDQKQYAVARQAAESAREADPNNADAIAMLGTIQSQMRLEKAKAQQPPPDATARATPTTAEAATMPTNERQLKPTDINIIRQAELRPTDAGVRIRFDRDVKKRFIAHQAMSPADFNSLTVNDQVHEILTRGTPEMRRDIQILSDPPALFQYRRQIQPFLIANCATAGCHGGASGAAKFHLVTPSDSDLATYTNFYILQSYTKAMKSDTGLFGKGDLRMIDRQQPERSMILQYALPGAIAEYDHPDVPGYRPAVRGINDPRYHQILDWIGKSLRPEDQNNYGIDFPVQGSSTSATTQPASAPAAAAAMAATQPAAATPATQRGGNFRQPPGARPAMRPAPPPPAGAAPNRVGTLPR
jgi:hypothetical protein